MVRWGEEFQKLHPDVRFDISAGGAGKGMADALANAVDIGMVSREVYPEEVEKGAFWVSVTKDAVFPTVSEENPVWEDLRQEGGRAGRRSSASLSRARSQPGGRWWAGQR